MSAGMCGKNNALTASSQSANARTWSSRPFPAVRLLLECEAFLHVSKHDSQPPWQVQDRLNDLGRDDSYDRFEQSVNGFAFAEARAQLQPAHELIRHTFGRYVSEEVAASILQSPEGLELGGEEREVTILTSDLRGFTALVARLTPPT
jgi:hypothetical protein